MFNFEIARFRFRLVALDLVILPRDNKGNVLRGAFGTVFKDLCCGTACRKCSASPLRDACAYAAIFETSPPAGSERLRANQDVPRPFVFRPPMDSKSRYEPGQSVAFELILFGRARQYLAYFVLAFRELTERGFGVGRGRCRLESIEAQKPFDESWVPVYSDNDQCVRPALPSNDAQTLLLEERKDVSKITLEFLTPTELKHEGGMVRIPEFHQIVKRLRDRINALGYFYAGTPMDIDFAEFGRRAETVHRTHGSAEWLERTRLSTRTNQRHSIGGFVGEIQFEGDISEFVPLLNLGQWTHVGKHAVWGNGQYRIC